MSILVIVCEECGARFRLDKALLKDSKAVRIRCRKCGSYIVVARPEAPAAAPPAAPSPVAEAPLPPESPVTADWFFSSKPAAVPSPVAEAPLPPAASIPPPGAESEAPDMVVIKATLEEMADKLPPQPVPPAAFEADISGVVRSEPEPAQPGTISTRPEDLFAFPPGEDAGPDRIPLPPEEYPVGGIPAEETAATEPERIAPPRRAPSMLAVLVISVLWVLLLAGGALYFGTMNPGQDRLGQLFGGWGSGRTGSAPERPVYDIRDVTWYVDKSSAGGSLLVIRGAVANVGKVPSAGIRIQATLLGKDNESLAEKAAFAGNLLDETTIRQTERAVIEGGMSNRFGEGNVNRDIPTGKTLPFAVVFFTAPGNIDAFKVNAVDAD